MFQVSNAKWKREFNLMDDDRKIGLFSFLFRFSITAIGTDPFIFL